MTRSLQRAIETDLFKTLDLLPNERKKDVVLGVKVGGKLNIPQLIQGENVPGSLQSIRILQGRRRAFDLKYLEIMLDVSGAGGHLDARSAIRMTEPVCRAFLIAFPMLQAVIAEEISVRDAYDKILQYRSQLLVSQGFHPLFTEDPSDRAFLRLCAMGRVADGHVARLFDRAFTTLPQDTKQRLVNGLNVDGSDDGEAVILYYMPGMFAESLRVTQAEPEQKRLEVIQSLLSFMARTYNGSKPNNGQPGKIIERDVSQALPIIRSGGFREDPAILDDFNLP